MKKLLALILAAALALSLVACGGGSGAGDNNSTNTPSGGEDATSTDTPNSGGEDSIPNITKEEMLEVAEDGDISELNSLIAENIVSAKQAYCGKTLIMKATVDEIKEDCIIFNHGMGSVIVYLPEEDIINLKTKQYITIVGITNDEFITTKESRYGPMAEDYTDCVMEQAYLVSDTLEVTATIVNEYEGEWNVRLESGVTRWACFDSSADISQYIGDKITFSAKLIDGKYYDAVIVE